MSEEALKKKEGTKKGKERKRKGHGVLDGKGNVT